MSSGDHQFDRSIEANRSEPHVMPPAGIVRGSIPLSHRPPNSSGTIAPSAPSPQSRHRRIVTTFIPKRLSRALGAIDRPGSPGDFPPREKNLVTLAEVGSHTLGRVADASSTQAVLCGNSPWIPYSPPGRLPAIARLIMGPWYDAIPSELHAVIHQEIDGLPAAERTVVILCGLQGRSPEWAARELGWPLRRLQRRLARALECLRVRLVQRGWDLAVGTWDCSAVRDLGAIVP